MYRRSKRRIRRGSRRKEEVEEEEICKYFSVVAKVIVLNKLA